VSLVVVGTNHKFSPIELRERISFSKKRLKEALRLLKERGVLNSAFILSTCNRVEIYATAVNSEDAVIEAINFISRYHEINKNRLCRYLYIYREETAIKHLYSVACGSDSLILGETQILDQLKFSFAEADAVGFIDEFLRKVFSSAVSFAKKIHRETKISEGKVSVGSVAIDFIKDKVGALSDKNILLIGVGKVTELVLRYLNKERPNIVFIANRTFEKAKILARQIQTVAVKFDKLSECLKRADVVITATASPHLIIKKESLKVPINRRLLIIDLALPRDVDGQVKEIENVELFCLEDLNGIIKKNIEKKAQEVEKIKKIIDKEARILWKEFTRLEAEPALLP
jgi:glutamyl-tRNA reductase